MFYRGRLVGGLLGRSSTDNMAGEKLGNIFIIRYVWLWSNPEGKYFYPAFLEQHLDTSNYLPSLEIQLILNHLGFLFLFQWKDRDICPPNQTSHLVLHQNICVRLIDPRCLFVAKLSRLKRSQSFVWTFYADLVKLIPFFPSLWHWKMDCFCSWNLTGQAEAGSTEESYNYVKICSVLTYLFVSFLLYFLSFFL